MGIFGRVMTEFLLSSYLKWGQKWPETPIEYKIKAFAWALFIANEKNDPCWFDWLDSSTDKFNRKLLIFLVVFGPLPRISKLIFNGAKIVHSRLKKYFLSPWLLLKINVHLLNKARVQKGTNLSCERRRKSRFFTLSAQKKTNMNTIRSRSQIARAAKLKSYYYCITEHESLSKDFLISNNKGAEPL